MESGDELLLELVAEATKELCGYGPTYDQVLAFLNTLARKTKPPIVPPNPPIRQERGKAPPTRLRVTMDDGKVIEHEDGSDTFVAVIEVFGIEQVHALKLGTERHPLISRKNKGEDPGKHRKSDTSDSYSIYTTFSTEDKKKHLEEVDERLGKQLQQIDIVPKS